MKLTFRWFGEKLDSISIKKIRQIPMLDGIVSSLMDIPVGEIWPQEKINNLAKTIKDNDLNFEVIESVNIHEDIKLGLASRDKWIDNYIQTMKNLSKIGIKVICYNFMPVLDWARSELYYNLPDGSNTMYFNKDFILNTTPQELADRYAKQSNGIALPGWEPERLVHINKTIEWYTHISQEQYWQNVAYFINRIIPWAEKLDIKMAIHPDDPPWPIFALPRLINNYENIKRFLDINPSVYHGITLCTGSIGVDANNDLIKIIQKFGNRIHFAHVRNLKFLNNGDFYETSHPSSCGSFDMYEIMKALYKSAPNIYIRPDHGRMIWNETGRPGYGLYDRALGITYLYGLWEAISKRDKEK